MWYGRIISKKAKIRIEYGQSVPGGMSAYFSLAMCYLSPIADIKLVLCDTPQRVQKLLANKSQTPNLKTVICFHCVHECVKKLTMDSDIEVVTFNELEVQQYTQLLVIF